MFSPLRIAALAIVFAGLTQAQTPTAPAPDSRTPGPSSFPHIVSKDLAGNSVDLPAGFPAERTVVLLAFIREQQHDVDGWVAGLHLDQGKQPWVEMPVIDNPGVLGRWFIATGMRRGIHDHETWKHVITLYTKKTAFMASVGLTSQSTVYAIVVDRKGTILASVSGPFTPHAGELIQAACRT